MQDTYEIIYDSDKGRYVIVDGITGSLVDDAQGYGYKTYEKAMNFILYKSKYTAKIVDNSVKSKALF